MKGFARDGVVYTCDGAVNIDDNIISRYSSWSSLKISQINVTEVKKVDTKPIYSNGVISYVKNNITYTTTNAKQWFYFIEDDTLKMTIFIDGEEITMDNVSKVEGLSPTVEIETNTEDEFVLKITDINGSYLTPNLKSSSATVTINNTLTSTSIKEALSANMGRVLKEEIDKCLVNKGEINDLDNIVDEGLYSITPTTLNNPFGKAYGKCLVFKNPSDNTIHQTVFKTSIIDPTFEIPFENNSLDASVLELSTIHATGIASRYNYYENDTKKWCEWNYMASSKQVDELKKQINVLMSEKINKGSFAPDESILSFAKNINDYATKEFIVPIIPPDAPAEFLATGAVEGIVELLCLDGARKILRITTYTGGDIKIYLRAYFNGSWNGEWKERGSI